MTTTMTTTLKHSLRIFPISSISSSRISQISSLNNSCQSISSSCSLFSLPRRFISAEARAALERETAGKLRRFKPTTPSLRHTVLVDRSNLWQGYPVKSLTKGLRKTGGRSRSDGHITVRHRGGGHKRLYRFIDFKRSIQDEIATVERIEYDPNRSAFIALLSYAHTSPVTLKYIVAPDELKIGDKIISSRTREVDIVPGNACPIGLMPVGSVFHCLELQPGRGAQLARGAGTKCRLIDKNSKPGFGLVELASKEQRFVPLQCLATIGQVSNVAHALRKLGKAGRSRNLGRRPSVRGVAMNPVDHPHGGGGGKHKGTHSKSYSGVLAKGFKTRHARKPKHLIVVPRGGMKKGTKGGFAGFQAGKA